MHVDSGGFVSSGFLRQLSGGPATAVTYTIGGTVINLAGTGGGLQLQDNGSDSLLVNASGTFTFPTALANGSAYSVTVSVQPSSPAESCGVTHGIGMATANVANIVVDCGHHEWVWEGGSKFAGQLGTYGTPGVAAPGNVPGARQGAISSTDAAGNFWLFGGFDSNLIGANSYFNDLWKYSASQWTWEGGSNIVNQKGTYGTQGTPAPGNVPGARSGAISWIDAAGNFWLFGGFGVDSTGTSTAPPFLNDLWKYEP